MNNPNGTAKKIDDIIRVLKPYGYHMERIVQLDVIVSRLPTNWRTIRQILLEPSFTNLNTSGWLKWQKTFEYYFALNCNREMFISEWYMGIDCPFNSEES